MKEYYIAFFSRALSKQCIPGLLGLRRRRLDCYECPVARCVYYPDGVIRVTVCEDIARRLACAAERKAGVVIIVPVENGRGTKNEGGTIWL